MQAAGDNHAVARWEHGVAGEDVGLGVRVRTGLPRQGQFPEAAGNGDRLVSISMDDGGEKHLHPVRLD